MRTRTVMAQHEPYPPLSVVTEAQQISEFTDVSGTLAGFRMPEYEQGISVAGYHLHFIDDDRRRGGHCLEFELDRGSVAMGCSSELHLSLPQTAAFLAADLSSGDVDGRIRRAEGQERS